MQVSFWEQTSFYKEQDFIIAGAGLAGLWIALELKGKLPKASILILERGAIPCGASTRNAGFACFGSPTEMISDAKKVDEDAMWSVVEMRYKGIDKIRKTFTDDVIDFDHCGGYECFKHDDGQYEQVNAQLDWLNKGMKAITGKENVFTWANKKLDDVGFSGFSSMIENKLEGGIHSGKYVQAMQQLVASKGITILYNTELLQWEEVQDKVHVRTHQQTFTCSQLILATNAFLPRITNDTTIQPNRGQVLVTAPINDLKVKGTFHFDEGYYYFRNVGNRILLGGARNTAFDAEATDEMNISGEVQEALEHFLFKHILPNTKVEITHRWSGIMAFTNNKLPYLHLLQKNVLAVSACNGMGVALTPVIAEKVVQQLTGSFNEKEVSSSLLLSPTL
ncbi:NAD(P)/FAD-dependent oxidoreductase [Aridibaculum aurantiacum]|uniref:NAD(P)/FAD-dependent oxidoreductase n=1 Tax=Aridibaculum aurantiacum TaxID=2810307 RepID=UPI001A9595F8|nr:FAD-binding oxidoreductase [Aridibaculum aurantiacum]